MYQYPNSDPNKPLYPSAGGAAAGGPPPTTGFNTSAPPTGYAAPPPTAGYQYPSYAAAPPTSSPYGAPPTQPQYGAPPTQPQYGAPPTTQPQYGAPPTTQPQYGAPPTQPQYSAPPTTQPQYGAPPTQQQYNAPPTQPQYGAPPTQQQQQQQYNAPPTQQQQQQQYNAPPTQQQQQYNAPPTQQQQQQQQYNAPPTQQQQQYNAPPTSQAQPHTAPPVSGFVPLGGQTQYAPPTAQPLASEPPQPNYVPPFSSGQPTTAASAPGLVRPATFQPPAPATTPTPAPGPRIDPSQIPSPTVGIEGRTVRFHSHLGSVPPAASSQFVSIDEANCTPRFMRMSLYGIPVTDELLQNSKVPLAVIIQPFADVLPGEEPVPVVDLPGGPIRCSRCRAYMNPFNKFADAGRKFACKICDFVNEVPASYFAPLEPSGNRQDKFSRPELLRGSVDWAVTSADYYDPKRPPAPLRFLFAIDVSQYSVNSGALQTVLDTIKFILNEVPDGAPAKVAFITFDTTVHFWNLRRGLNQPQMMVVSDTANMFLPMAAEGLFVSYAESKNTIDFLLERLPFMFQQASSGGALGPALQAGSLALESTGGKLVVFQSSLAERSVGGLRSREDFKLYGTEKEKTLFAPQVPFYRTLAQECVQRRVCVDFFVFAPTYVDLATIGVLPSLTGGQLYHYPAFTRERDGERLHHELVRHVTRFNGFDAVMKVRTSSGLATTEFYGNFYSQNNSDFDIAGVDSDKSFAVLLKHDSALEEKAVPVIQCAILYTTARGERRIRVHTLGVSCTSVMGNVFRNADLDTLVNLFTRTAIREIPNSQLSEVRSKLTERCVDILAAYRKYCASNTSQGQLILPEALKLLPIYTIALCKHTMLRTGTDVTSDDRVFYMQMFNSVAVAATTSLIYPRMYALHKLPAECGVVDSEGRVILPGTVRLSVENIEAEGVYLLENGLHMYIWLSKNVAPELLQQLFGVASQSNLSGPDLTRLFVEQENETSHKVHNIIRAIRRQRGNYSYPQLQVVRQREPLEARIALWLVEDKQDAMSYVDYLCHVHKLIQQKLA